MFVLHSAVGTSIVPFQKKRLTHMSGWMALIPNAKHINWYFKDVGHITNISYTSTFYGFKVKSYKIHLLIIMIAYNTNAAWKVVASHADLHTLHDPP